MVCLRLLIALTVGLSFFSDGQGQPPPKQHEAQLVGRVIDTDGRPLSSVALALVGSQQTWRQVSDEFGAFRFAGLPEQEYVFVVEKVGFLPSSQKLALEAGMTQEVEMVLEPTASLAIVDRVTVIGNPAGLDTVPGSAHYLDPVELKRVNVDFGDIHHFLRQIPGINIQEEDGFGLRPNIGFRGSGSERSSSITLMEDGVLIAPAPYAAPSAYYFPTAGRMDAVEVRKGSSQIKYGPRTTGGALNLLSTPIPNDLTLDGTVAVGAYSTRRVHAHLGDSYDHIGWLLETYQIANQGFKELDGGGNTGFDLGDYVTKLRFNSGQDAAVYQQLEIKLGYTHQNSRETYLGLSESDFRFNPLRRYRGSQKDVFDGTHEQYQARYFVALTDRLDFTATVYRNNFRRNWYKLQSVLDTGLGSIFDDVDAHADEMAILRGQDSGPDALRLRANNRRYYSQGVEAATGLRLDSARVNNLLQFGLRYHEDQEDRFQHEDGFRMQTGTMVQTSWGSPGSNANRVSDASAWAFFAQDTIQIGRLNLVPGLRYESIELVRTDYSTSDPDRNRATRVRTNNVGALVPGLGVNFQLRDHLGLFGGVHRGFSPPGPGSTEETEPEWSLNYEVGARLSRRPLHLMVAAFSNDYDNLLGADTLSSGGSGEGDLFNGGAARVAGLEASAFLDLGEVLESRFRVPFQVAYTYTDSEFKSSFESDYEPWGTVKAGDEFPYLPRHQFSSSLGLESAGWRTRLEAVHVSRMRTVAGQGPYVDARATDATLVFNVSAEYDVAALQRERSAMSLYLSLRNVANEEAIVARSPAGARPGLPRTLMGGIRFRLGR